MLNTKICAFLYLLLGFRWFLMEKTKKILSLKENHLFQKVYKKGKSYVSSTLVLYVLKNYDRKHTLVGITVRKNRGGAVIRNRIRRKIKEAYRILSPFVKDGFIIVIVARTACKNAHFTVIQDELYALLKKAALLGDTEWRSCLYFLLESIRNKFLHISRRAADIPLHVRNMR